MRTRILNQYRTPEGRLRWAAYARGDRRFGTRNDLMSFSCRPDLKTSSVMAGGQINFLLYLFEESYGK